MIIQTTRISRTGGVHYLAAHLLDKADENDRIEVLAGDRHALHDAQALAQAKGCLYSVRHLSVSPEREMMPADMSTFMRMVDAELGIGADRPRLVVRHIKKSRSHFHIAIAEVDPKTFRVLDCRNDFARLEDIARRYEAIHGEHVQPSRAERRTAKLEGFSDTARKRAERTSPGFDRTRLKCTFASGAAAFFAEVKAQGLRIEDGNKGAILVTSAGVFVAAANRAAGVRRDEFSKFMEEIRDDELIGSQSTAPEHAGDDRTQHQAAPAASGTAANTGRPRPRRAIDRTAPPDPRHAAAASQRVEVRHGQARSPLSALTGRRREDITLARISKELDDILRRARELAKWIASLFEPEADRLARRIAEARKRKLFPPPADTDAPVERYDYRRRMTP